MPLDPTKKGVTSLHYAVRAPDAAPNQGHAIPLARKATFINKCTTPKRTLVGRPQRQVHHQPGLGLLLELDLLGLQRK